MFKQLDEIFNEMIENGYLKKEVKNFSRSLIRRTDKIFFIFLLIMGVVGLKLVTNNHDLELKGEKL